MRVKTLIRALSKLPPDMEVVTYDDRYGQYSPLPLPEQLEIACHYDDFREKYLWEHPDFIDEEQIIEKKTVVVL